MCESLNCFWVKKNATVGFTGPAAKVMKFKIAHVQLNTKLQECAHAQCTNTLCITQLHNVHKVEDGACGNKAQAVDPIEHRHTGTRSHWAELGKSQLQVHTCTHCRRSHWGDLGNHSLCERISDSLKAQASQKTSRPGNLANKLFKRELSTSPNWQSNVTVMEMCQTEWWLMPEL